jgi:hypothetical protein
MCVEAANRAGGNVMDITQVGRRLPHSRGEGASAMMALQWGEGYKDSYLPELALTPKLKAHPKLTRDNLNRYPPSWSIVLYGIE